MRTKPQSKMSLVGMLITLAVITLFSCSHKAFAQQWSTSGNGNDISNTNSGNVGVGTTSPGVKLDILSSVNVIARFGSTAGAHSQVLIDAPAGFNSNLTLQRGGVSKWFIGNRASNDRLSFMESTGAVETLTLLQNGNVGIGTTSPAVDGIPFSLHLTLASSGINRPVFQFVSNIPDGIGAEAGFLDFIYNTNSAGHKRIGLISYETEGATANQRGSVMRLFTKANAGALLERMRIDSSGNVGIGTSAPNYRLDVQGGQINASGGLCIAGDCKTAWSQVGGPGSSPWGTNGTNIFYNAGNVGIGTTTPNRRLELVQDVGGISFEAGTGSPNSGVIRFGDTSGWKFHFGRSRNSVGGALNSGTSGVLMTIQDNGNVGISTTAPAFKLDVQGGQVNAAGGLCIAGDCKTAWSQVGGSSQWTTVGSNIAFTTGDVGIGTTTPAYKLDLNGNLNIRGGTTFFRQSSGLAGNEGANLSIGANINNEASLSLNVYRAGAYTSRFTVNNFGQIVLQPNGDANVGIGVNNPAYKFDVQGGVVNASGGLCIAGDCKTAWSQLGGSQWTTSGTTINYTNGNVGIGTTGPNFKLQVTADSTAGQLAVTGSSNTNKQLRLGFNTTSDYGLIEAVIDGTAFKNLALQPNGGNVGIATSNPTEKLHVTGNGKITGNLTVDGTVEGGNIKAKYQDVAEWVESSQELPAGTVVVVDHTKSNQVIASSQAYDTRVAGVISERPGITLGEGGNNKVLVATTGRVMLTVDASKGPIQIGDLLVTSDIPGLAMKSQPINVGGVQIHRPGTLVGKALEPLPKGQGKILVLLSLQ